MSHLDKGRLTSLAALEANFGRLCIRVACPSVRVGTELARCDDLVGDIVLQLLAIFLDLVLHENKRFRIVAIQVGSLDGGVLL